MFESANDVFVVTAKVDGFRVWFKKLKRVRLYYLRDLGWGYRPMKVYYSVRYEYT